MHFTETLLAGLRPLIGTVGDVLDNTLTETGLYKTECTRDGSSFPRWPVLTSPLTWRTPALATSPDEARLRFYPESPIADQSWSYDVLALTRGCRSSDTESGSRWARGSEPCLVRWRGWAMALIVRREGPGAGSAAAPGLSGIRACG